MNIASRSTEGAGAGAPTAVSVVEISDPTAVGETIEVLRQDAVQLKSGPLLARRTLVRLDRIVLVFHSTNLPVRTRTSLRDGLVAFTALGPRAFGTFNGMPCGPGQLLATASGVEVEIVVAGGYESVALLVPPDDLRAHLRGRHRDDAFRPPDGVELLRSRPEAARGLYDLGRRLVAVAARQAEVFDVPQTQAAAQVDLLESLMTALGPIGDSDSVTRDPTRQAHSRAVRAAEDYALAHTAERLYVTDLCEAVGVSERTLEYAFKEVMGMTPVAYLARLRLHRVRQALRATTHRSTTVTAEALRWGFWHFGDFSRAYKACFAELPSETAVARLARGGRGRGGASVTRVIQDHRRDDRAEQVVDDLGAVLAEVDGVKPELLVEVFLNGEHALNAAGLDGLAARAGASAGAGRCRSGRA
jgi:AraC-like DNA-binding protein